MQIEDSVKVVKRAQAAEALAKRERDKINETAKQQRIEIRRLKRLLEEAMKLIPSTVRADKLFEEIDDVLHKDEL